MGRPDDRYIWLQDICLSPVFLCLVLGTSFSLHSLLELFLMGPAKVLGWVLATHLQEAGLAQQAYYSEGPVQPHFPNWWPKSRTYISTSWLLRLSIPLAHNLVPNEVRKNDTLVRQTQERTGSLIT